MGGRSPPNFASFPMNFPLPSFGVEELQILSWNGGGICLSNGADRVTMGIHLKRLSKAAHILCLQEVHGEEGDTFHQLSNWLPGWKILVSCSLRSDGTFNGGAGGVAIAICPLLNNLAICNPQCVVPGRCLGTSICLGDKVLTVCNVHNYGLSFADTRSIKDFLFLLGSGIEVDPTRRIGILIGDLNIKAEHEKSFKIGVAQFPNSSRPPPDRGFSNPLFSGQRLAVWRQILSTWTEISQPMPTHFDIASKTCSRIDRCWIFGPSNLLIKLHIRSHVLSSPEGYYGQGLSDHAPFVVSLGKQIRSSSSSHPLPKFVCKHPQFERHVHALASSCDILGLPVHKQLTTLKTCFREASKRVLLEIQHDETNSLEAQRLAFSSISRAIWFNNVCLAKKLLLRSELAKLHMQILNGRVSIINPAFFDVAFNECHAQYLSGHLKDLRKQSASSTSANIKKQIKSRVQCFQRLQSVYWPTGKRMFVTGVVISTADGSSSLASSPTSIQAGLKEYWEPVYSAKRCDEDKAKKLVDLYIKRCGHLLEFALLEEPVVDDFLATIQHCKHSACGEDGVPYGAYKATPLLSSQILLNSSNDLASPSPSIDLAAFNKQLVWFAPKGVADSDKVAVHRTPSNLRIIFGSNCDSQLCSGTIAYKFVQPTLQATPKNQRGFCKGRQLSLNSVDLDVFMRLFNSKFDISSLSTDRIGRIPISVLYDFCNAFPTLLHFFLFLMLKGLGVPQWYFNAILSLYKDISAYSSGTGDGSFLFYVLCGVKTGCPLSSILFLLCVNPFIDLFNWLSDNPGFSITRVCADDFGSTMDQLYRIKTQASIFKLAAGVAGLHLKPSKCIIIVSCIELSDDIVDAIRLWLSHNVPDFMDFCICSSGKYLGWHLGINSVALSFEDPMKKVVTRVHEVVAGHGPVTSAILRYNQRIVPVLSFVSQFAHPPDVEALLDLDQWAIHKLLRIPAKCLPRNMCHSISVCTEVDPIPLSSYCSANLIRFAHSEREYLLQLHSDILRISAVSPRQDCTPLVSANASDFVNLFELPRGGLSDPPILATLLHALKLTGSFSDFREDCLCDPSRVWLVDYPGVCFPPAFKSFQSAALHALSLQYKVPNLYFEFHRKVKVTLQPFAPFDIPNFWWEPLYSVLQGESTYIKCCWLKTVCGAWCTSTRLSTFQNRPCIFGCEDSRDELCHYLVCPALWQLALHSLRISEVSILFLHRICVSEPTHLKLQTLAFCHALYHTCVNDTACIDESGMPRSPYLVQKRASETCNYCLHLVGGR